MSNNDPHDQHAPAIDAEHVGLADNPGRDRQGRDAGQKSQRQDHEDHCDCRHFLDNKRRDDPRQHGDDHEENTE